MNLTKIPWAQMVWNLISGCTWFSEGCGRCYARRQAVRLKGMHPHRYGAGFDVVKLHIAALTEPMRRRKPTVIFPCSMSDLFHEKVPDSFILSVIEVIRRCPQHVFLVLTKRSARMRSLLQHYDLPSNLFLGVSVENKDCYNRIRDLQQIPAALRFVSATPLLGSLDAMPLAGIGWVIVGGEKGPGARPMDLQWAREIKDRCIDLKIPVFYIGQGGTWVTANKRGIKLDGVTYRQSPPVVQAILDKG